MFYFKILLYFTFLILNVEFKLRLIFKHMTFSSIPITYLVQNYLYLKFLQPSIMAFSTGFKHIIKKGWRYIKWHIHIIHHNYIKSPKKSKQKVSQVPANWSVLLSMCILHFCDCNKQSRSLPYAQLLYRWIPAT